MKKLLKKLLYGKLNFLFKGLVSVLTALDYAALSFAWKLKGGKKPTPSQQKQLAQKVTFIFKSFERQGMAKRLYKSIRKYYPDVKIVIADDSKRHLEIRDDNLEIIQMPFNSGLSAGLNRALERVKTPYVIRMDDDMLLTPFSNFNRHLEFLESDGRVDLVAVSCINAIRRKSLLKTQEAFLKIDMSNALKPLLIPHKTKLSNDYTVVAKPPNIFIVRTDAIRKVGYDDNIRMIDHHEFFMRAAGVLVTACDFKSFVYHYHNILDKNYLKYRTDYLGDKKYIRAKFLALANAKKQ